MKKILREGSLFSLLLVCAFTVKAQMDTVTEVRHYDYCTDIIGSANQLYRMVVAGHKGRLSTWKDILVTNTRPETAIALSPSGSNFVVANDKSEVEIWSLEKRNTRLGDIREHRGVVRTLDYSRDSRYLLSGGDDKTVRIWDTKDWSLFKILPCMYPVNAACFSPNGAFVACDQGNDIVVYNFVKDIAVQGLNGGHKQSVTKLKFSDDGKYLLSLDRAGLVNIWRIAGGDVWCSMTLPGGICDVDIHHNNKYLAVLDSTGNLQVWNLKKNILVQTLESQEAGRTVHFCYDYDKESALLTHCDKRHCYIWDVVRLEPAFDLLAAKMHEGRMGEWNRRRTGETSEAYAARVSDSLAVQNAKVMSEVLTVLGTEWRPLGKPKLGAYDTVQKGVVITFPQINSFVLKMEQADVQAFEQNFARCEFSKPVYTLDEKDDFGLAYLEVNDPVKQQRYYLDHQNRPPQVQKKIVAGGIVKKVGEEEAVLKQKLKDYFDKEVAKQRISDHIKVNVEASPKIGVGDNGQPVVDYHIAYSYEVMKTDKKEVGDWAPGRYMLDESNAAAASVQVIRETFEKELAGYIQPGKSITIKITGSADGAPILRPIKYTGVYGDFDAEPYYLNGNMDNITISYKTGIATNNQLAYLRTYGVRHFIRQEIPVLLQTRNTFEHHVFVSESRGNEFRRVSIEIIIHDAFQR